MLKSFFSLLLHSSLTGAMLASMASAQPTASKTGSSLAPTLLRCDNRQNPIGVDSTTPSLSWQFMAADPAARGVKQTAYQILAASSVGLLQKDRGDLWDSGRITSDMTNQIVYAGKPLDSSTAVFWKVRIWDQTGTVSGWSPSARWIMGVLKPEDWQAEWISASEDDAARLANPLLRREFAVKPGLKSALVHVCGLGHYEMFMNGSKVGDQLLAPGWSLYPKTSLYDSYDITAMLKPGANATGITLGNGIYNVTGGRYTKIKITYGKPKAILQLRLEYNDGSVERIGTDATWQVASGPVTFNCFFGGEDYDARLEKTGWSQPGATGTDWVPATVVKGPGGELKGLSCAASPVKAIEELKTTGVKELSKEAAVYDLGQNASIMPRITVSGPAGSSVRLVPSELINANGDINDTMCKGNNWWQYTLRGGQQETWFPQFYYRGARYLKVILTPAPGDKTLPKVESLVGVVVHTSAEPIGEFFSSNTLFNDTFRIVRWAQRSNLVSIVTDCPHREKLGWLEQYHLNGPSLRYNYDLAALFSKGMRDMHDSQLDNGMIPTTAPEYSRFGGDFRDSPEWGAALILSALQQYEFHGDIAMLRSYYPDQQRYAEYLGKRANNHIINYGLGDWYDIGPKPPGNSQLTPKALTGTATYYEEIRAMARIAEVLGKTEDSQRYMKLAGEIREAFNQKFFNAETKQYATGSQCANAMPLALDMVNDKDREAVVKNLVNDVETKGLTAGDVGHRYLLRALANHGRSDIVFSLHTRTDRPGYGMQLAKGVTALTEAWDANPGSSQNHFMLGHINEWFYHDLAGIPCDPAGPGFKKIIIRPAPVRGLEEVKATFRSDVGPILSHWKKQGNRLGLKLEVPINTNATVYLPAKDLPSITESGQSIRSAKGVKFIRQEGTSAIFEVSSGSYQFSSTLPLQ